LFDGERDHGKVTGNNVVSWTPKAGDWYETVKLNYGFDFTQGRHGPKEFPTAIEPGKPIPDTWLKMDAVLAHWQALGVDGFRCDMAHWVPMEFWRWAIARARERRPGALFVAEAYDNDPNKLTDGNVLTALVEAGFDAVYDHQSYDVLKDLYDGPKWANDLDSVLGAVAPLHRSLRYAENHDEVRLANPTQWGGLGAAVGRPVSALLFGIGRGPVLIYNGQEVGEPAKGARIRRGRRALEHVRLRVHAGACQVGERPSVRWRPPHATQRGLRRWYAHLLELMDEPAFRRGEFLPLNRANGGNLRFGMLAGESAGGHWLYAYVRHDEASRQRFLVVANLQGREALHDVRITFPPEAAAALGAGSGDGPLEFRDRLGMDRTIRVRTTAGRLGWAEIELPLWRATAWYSKFARSQDIETAPAWLRRVARSRKFRHDGSG
jgi:hypothetical protein